MTHCVRYVIGYSVVAVLVVVVGRTMNLVDAAMDKRKVLDYKI